MNCFQTRYTYRNQTLKVDESVKLYNIAPSIIATENNSSETNKEIKNNDNLKRKSKSPRHSCSGEKAGDAANDYDDNNDNCYDTNSESEQEATQSIQENRQTINTHSNAVKNVTSPQSIEKNFDFDLASPPILQKKHLLDDKFQQQKSLRKQKVLFK